MAIAVRGSIRKQLLIALIGGFILIWSLSGLVTLLQVRAQVSELLDINLRQSAMPLLHEIEEAYPEHAFSLFRYSSNVIFQIWESGTTLRLHSKKAPLTHLSDNASGFSDNIIDGEEWRIFSVWDPSHRYLVQVGELKLDRKLFAQKILHQLLASLALTLPLFGAMIWLVVGGVLRPVGQIRDEIARRDPKFLEPIAAAVPREIAPLMERLNELLLRMQTSLDNERRFTGDAAHELRTPLAAAKSQIQVALAATDHTQCQRALENALQATDSATHRIEQMLLLARLDHEAWQKHGEAIDLRAAAAQAIGEVAAFAAHKHIALALEGASAFTAQAGADLWIIFLRNLLDNAIRYSPPHSSVTVRIAQFNDCIELSVCDQGPGIPPQQYTAAQARFNRLGEEGGSGSGLGLSIVARIAELHRATLSFGEGENGCGLCVRLRIPKSPAAR